ncbi:MAG: hypothetical protein R3E97_00205 [Candidatus Eisenbacteria bacterium]
MADNDNDNTPIERKVWDRQQLESFVRKLKHNPSSTLPPALEDLRRAGTFDPPVTLPKETLEGAESDETTGRGAEAGSASRSGSGAAGQAAVIRIDTTDRKRPAGPRVQLALSAFLPDEVVATLSTALTEQFTVVETDTLSAAIQGIELHHPTFVFTGLEFEPLHAPSLIAALKACPTHRSVPIAVITPQDPRLLDLSFYRPDAVLRLGATFQDSVREFVSEFTFEDKHTGRGPHGRFAQCRGKVLLAESSAMIQRVVGKLIHVAGADVTVVENVTETMLATSSHEFELIFLDLELPHADPAELVPFIRATCPGARVIGLTSDTLDPSTALVDTILEKPVRRSLLFSVCTRWLNPPAHGARPGRVA